MLRARQGGVYRTPSDSWVGQSGPRRSTHSKSSIGDIVSFEQAKKEAPRPSAAAVLASSSLLHEDRPLSYNRIGH